MDKQFYLIDCKGIQIDNIQSLLFTTRQIQIPIVNSNLYEILELRRNNREQIKIIYIKSPLSMRYENIRKENNDNNDVEQVLNYVIDDAMIGRKMLDVADLIVEINEDSKLASITDLIWQFIRKERSEED